MGLAAMDLMVICSTATGLIAIGSAATAVGGKELNNKGRDVDGLDKNASQTLIWIGLNWK
jgi:hypothetical protein